MLLKSKYEVDRCDPPQDQKGTNPENVWEGPIELGFISSFQK